ncbi:MAG: hypothetical protein EOO53_11390 [Gammaproteobacteria bacterium]|nr:MAG: hypothetical protein EOO53_11390 [Gammaproteobacteria bacterium]
MYKLLSPFSSCLLSLTQLIACGFLFSLFAPALVMAAEASPTISKVYRPPIQTVPTPVAFACAHVLHFHS